MNQRRFSLGAKMYVLITAAIIAVSVPLLLITNAAYRRTVIEPYTKNLESIESIRIISLPL